MPQDEKVHARMQSLDDRLARLRMEKNRLQARATHAERKRDTRRKILIGGAVLAAIDREGVPAMTGKSQLLPWVDRPLARSPALALFGLPTRPPPLPARPSAPRARR